MGDADLWWQRGVIYQIYPRSFQDSTGDGIGDLQGIIDRLDYLNDGTEHSLGIDAIWLSPTYPSPMKDFGYDVSDYTDVHPDFGDLATMDRLIAACHRRGIRVLLDFVPNHTSDQHPWFRESRSSRDNPKRDWYIWRDPKPDGSPPNNWEAMFGGPSWQWDERTGQYYLHSFLVEQPDLNWRNPELIAAMHDVLRFWLRRGIDGFRIDVAGFIMKHPDLPDNPILPIPAPPGQPSPGVFQDHVYDRNWPDVFDRIRGFRGVLDEFPERMAVGEVFGAPEIIAQYYGGDTGDGLHLAFNFGFIYHDHTPTGFMEWDAQRVRFVADAFHAALPSGAWPNYVFGNHDVPRLVTRFGGGDLGRERARVAALLLLTLHGTPFIYYGEELGMEDVPIPAHLAQDPARIHTRGRDPQRTPMPWTSDEGRGFTTGTPWLPFSDPAISVAAQDADPDSLLNLYRRLLWVRRRSDALIHGAYRALDGMPPAVFAYLREAATERLLIALNFGPDPVDLPLPEGVHDTIALHTHRADEATPITGTLRLAGNAGAVLRLR